MDFAGFMKVFVACYFGFVALHYMARLAGLRARRGFAHAPVGRPASRNGRHQIVFRAFRAAILAVMAARVPWPQIDGWLFAFPLLETVPIALFGFVLMVVGLFVVDYCHSYLDDDWRSGTGGPSGVRLVVEGPYAVSRNPIFIGILLGQAGLFLAAPSLFTLVCAAIGGVVILRQVRVEEDDLERRFGDRYRAYLFSTPRYFGGWGLRRAATSSARD